MHVKVLSMGTSNYPETLGNCYIVNAPWVFNLLWSAISPMLKQSTQDKILVCGADYKEVLPLNQHGTAPHSTTQHHTAPHSATLHHTAPHSTTQHHSSPHSTT
jgi:hypothetical protein